MIAALIVQQGLYSQPLGQPLGTIGDSAKAGGFGPFGNVGFMGARNIAALSAKFTGVISVLLAMITISAGIWFLIQFVIGAFKWMTSGGDKNNVEAAKEHLTHAVIGLAILVAAYVIAGLIGVIFGLDILNPQTVINNLSIY